MRLNEPHDGHHGRAQEAVGPQDNGLGAPVGAMWLSIREAEPLATKKSRCPISCERAMSLLACLMHGSAAS